MDQLGAVAGKQYQGDGLSVTATAEGVRLRCGFQKLDGHATAEGVWLESTAPDSAGKLRLVATAVGREVVECGSPLPLSVEAGPFQSGRGLPQSTTLSRWGSRLSASGEGALAAVGTVWVEGKVVRFIRPGLTEQYSVSVDGVRQDFVIAERPAGAGDLRVELALSGARAEAAAYGARLTLEGSGRALAYSRLRVSDATGQELTARLEVLSADRLAVRVADAHATYPVRIDPTFSDADWISLNPGMPGANSYVYAVAADPSGNVYVGGAFTFIGTVPANYIAKWDGSAWSALGSGMNGRVYALAVSGTNLYAGGEFFTAGGVLADCIAKWNGSAWSALGSGMSGGQPMIPQPIVYALAVSGTDLYAGGNFTTAGGVAANRIAKWDGSAWSSLGSGMSGSVYALAVIGTNLYAGGDFTTAGGVPANRIAKWDGSAWSSLGSGLDGAVFALAADGAGRLFVGGSFSLAGTNVSPFIAQANIGAAVTNGRFRGLAYSPVTGFSCTFSDATIGQPYRIQTSPSLAAGSWTDFTNFTYTGPTPITDTSAVAVPKKFYRAVTP